MADPVSGIIILSVGAVCAVFDAALQKPRLNLVSLNAQKRPYNIAVYRPYPAHSRKPCSPEQMKEHGFRTVIAVVRHGDSSLAALNPPGQRLSEETISYFSSRFFLSDPPSSCIILYVLLKKTEGQSLFSADVFHKIRILSRFPADFVVDVCNGKTKRYPLLEFKQHKKEADGIRAPRNSRNDAIIFPNHTIPLNIFKHFCDHTYTIAEISGKGKP